MNIAIFSGEVSGDLIGGALAAHIRRIAPDTHLWGIGSTAMASAGVELVADSAAWGAISITEAVTKLPAMLLRIAPKLRAELTERRPDVVVLIDFGAFNVRAARYCKAHGFKVVYYFPPGSWRRTGDKGRELGELTDLLLAPFPWAAERYRRLGARVEYVGHPLLDRVRTEMSRGEFAGHFGLDPTQPIVGLLPGSRRHEVSHLMPTLIDTARKIYSRCPGCQFVVGVAPSISLEMMRDFLINHRDVRDSLADIWHEFAQEAETKVWRRVKQTAQALSTPPQRQLATVGGLPLPDDGFKERLEAQRRQAMRRKETGLPPIVLAKGLTYEVMAHSDVLLTCSGTATLEAAIFETPMVILYRGSKIMEIEYYLRGMNKKLTHIGLPNILAERRIVPELIQHEATPEAIAKHALDMLNDPETRHRVKSDLRAVRECLGEAGASSRAAEYVIAVARGS